MVKLDMVLRAFGPRRWWHLLAFGFRLELEDPTYVVASVTAVGCTVELTVGWPLPPFI